LVITDPKF